MVDLQIDEVYPIVYIPARVLLLSLPNIKSESLIPSLIGLIEVLRVDYKKLSGDRVGDPSECIGARVQAARNIQLQRFSTNGSPDIICNADMRVGIYGNSANFRRMIKA